MEQKPIACGKRLPPWLIAQNLDGTENQTFHTIHKEWFHYKSRIPKLLGTNIRGYFHGWVILCDKNMWSLWNPVASEIINLPPLFLNNHESVGQCCLSSPPDEPTSILLLTITEKPTFVFCQLGFKKDRLRWTRMPYIRQFRETLGRYRGFLQWPTSYNGKIYAMCNHYDYVIQVDIKIEDGKVLINLLPFGRLPKLRDGTQFSREIRLLLGTCKELLCVIVAFNEVTKISLGNVYLFKCVMTSMRWEELVDIKDTVFFLDLACNYTVYYDRAIVPELGGYMHIRDETGRRMYSYDVKDKIVSTSCMAYPAAASHVSMWECRSGGDNASSDQFIVDSEKKEDKNNKMDVRSATDDEIELNESHLLNLPHHLLELIMDRCIGVEYMSFRATCKSFHLAAPLVQWSNKTSSRKLHGYSLVSPWLMVVDKTYGIINFTDPMSGDKYFMKRPVISINKILCSRYGWLLFRTDEWSNLVFYNPFTNDIRKLPRMVYYLHSFCFSAPPTSPDCVVVGFIVRSTGAFVYIYFVSREQTWRNIAMDLGGDIPDRFYFPTFSGLDLYVLSDKGEVYVLRNLLKSQGYYVEKVAGARSCELDYYLVKHGQQILLVIVDNFGKHVEVFKVNDYTRELEKIRCLGRYTIYIGCATCLCIEAKSPEMENKIFFERLHSRNGEIVFYSLETNRYHMFNGKNIEDVAGVGWEYVYPHAWIEPTWS